MIKRLLLILLVAGAVGGATYALKQKKLMEMAAMSGHEMPPAAVSVTPVRAAEWRQSLFAIGSLAAEQGIEVTAPLPGTIIGIQFESGQAVARGQVLATMDIGVQEAELVGLIAARELREQQLARAAKLLADKQVAQSDYDSARAARDEAAALVLTRQAIIDRKKIYAPFDGVLGIRMIDVGDYVEPGDPVVPLQMLDPIHVDYAVPEQFLSRLALGQVVEIEVPAYPGERFSGRITAFDPGIDPSTRNQRIRATLANPDKRLRPGMFAQVWTIEAAAKAVLALPETAIAYSPYGNSVFVVIERDGALQVERRQVQTGEVREGQVEISSGLTLGERVVAVGHNKLRNGMAVTVTDEMAGVAGAETP